MVRYSNSGQCPKCASPISYVNLETVSVKARGASWNGVSYLCPSCNAVLSVEIDPIALKTDIVREVADEVVSRLRRG